MNTDNLSPEVVAENLFGPQVVYYQLFKKEGDEAKGLLSSIIRQGPLNVLSTLLVNSNLNPSNESKNKPWGILDKKYQLGDYFLVWNESAGYVAIFEQNIPSDPYSNV